MLAIRPQTLDDIPAVAALHVRAWQAGYAGMIPAEVLNALDPAVLADRRRQWHGHAEFQTLLALDGPEIIGFTTFGPYRLQQNRTEVDPTVGEVNAIYLEPARIGTGVGRTLMAAALAELARRGFREVRLWVLEKNHRSRRFYEKAGFAKDGEQATFDVTLPSSGEAVPLPEIRYTRTLDAAG
jgi:GNAT superfamily N-acetyltransferase